MYFHFVTCVTDNLVTLRELGPVRPTLFVSRDLEEEEDSRIRRLDRAEAKPAPIDFDRSALRPARFIADKIAEM